MKVPMSYIRAHDLVMATHRHAAETGVKVSTAVVDIEGRLLAFGRMEDSRWLSIDVAIAKAHTAALFGRGGQGLSQLPIELVSAVASIQGRGLMAGLGTAALEVDGAPVGFIACSGARGEEDQACADFAATQPP